MRWWSRRSRLPTTVRETWSCACYESLGGRAQTSVKANFAVGRASITDLLERQLVDLEVGPSGVVSLQLRPFQVITLRLSPEK